LENTARISYMRESESVRDLVLTEISKLEHFTRCQPRRPTM